VLNGRRSWWRWSPRGRGLDLEVPRGQQLSALTLASALKLKSLALVLASEPKSLVLALASMVMALALTRLALTPSLVAGGLCVWLSVVRNLSGHKAAIRSVELYPFGEFAASTSADHHIKVCARPSHVSHRQAWAVTNSHK